MLYSICRMKFAILIISFALFLYSLTKYNSSISSQEVLYNSDNKYIDLYFISLQNQKTFKVDVLGFFFMIIYSLKFFQLFPTIQNIFIALKNSLFHISLLLIQICVILVIIAMITHSTYGSYLYEFRTFGYSFIYSIKLFIFSESTLIIRKMFNYYRAFTVIFFIFFIFLIRFFFLKLLFPIIMERYRFQVDSIALNNINPVTSNPNKGKRNMKENILNFLFPIRIKDDIYINKIKDDVDENNNNNNNNE